MQVLGRAVVIGSGWMFGVPVQGAPVKQIRCLACGRVPSMYSKDPVRLSRVLGVKFEERCCTPRENLEGVDKKNLVGISGLE